MHGRAQVAVRGEFQQFADVDHEGAVSGRHIDPAPRGLDLQASLVVLQQQGNQFGIFVRADSQRIAAAGVAHRSGSGIADKLHQIMRVIAIQRLERVGSLAERQGEGAQDSDEHLDGGGLPAIDHRPQLRQCRRPLIRSLQSRPCRRAPIARERRPLGADIDLLAPVRPAASALRGDSIVAAKMR